jgi:hypothetical protein
MGDEGSVSHKKRGLCVCMYVREQAYRSFSGSMPWLISSTTLNNASDRIASHRTGSIRESQLTSAALRAIKIKHAKKKKKKKNQHKNKAKKQTKKHTVAHTVHDT